MLLASMLPATLCKLRENETCFRISRLEERLEEIRGSEEGQKEEERTKSKQRTGFLEQLLKS